MGNFPQIPQKGTLQESLKKIGWIPKKIPRRMTGMISGGIPVQSPEKILK